MTEWSNVKKFPCPGVEDYSLGVGEQYYKKAAFLNGKVMYQAAAMNQKYRKSFFLRIPLDFNVEYKAFGGKVKWNGNRYISSGYIYHNIDEIGEILTCDYEVQAFSLIYQCLSYCPAGEDILLGVEGPFSVLCSLIDPVIILRNLRKKGSLIKEVLFRIADILVSYIVDCIRLGVSVISYADPIGTMEFLGKKNYKEYNGEVTAYLLRKLEPWLSNSCIHFCGKCSLAMEQSGLMTATRLEAEGAYGQEVLSYAHHKDVAFLGHGCINCEKMKVKKLWKMTIQPEEGADPYQEKNIQILSMEEKHRERVLEIYKNSIEKEDVTLVTDPPKWEEWDKAHDRNCRFVASLNGQIVGFIVLAKAYQNPVYHGIGEISIYVDEKFRNRGIGFAMMEKMIEISRKYGYDTLQSRIFPENKASICLHRKAGFYRICYREKMAKKNGVWRDVCVFERRTALFEET